MRNIGRSLLVLALLCATLPGLAEERFRKWIFEFSFGGYDPVDEVRSDSANLATFTENDGTVRIRADPRPDRLESSVMQIDSTSRIDFRAGYGVAEWGWGELILDAGIAYMDGEISGMEIAYQNCGVATDVIQCNQKFDKDFNLVPIGWRTDNVAVGELRQIPVSLNTLVRFRPTKRLNPYGGLGAGYLFVEFEEDPEFTRIAEFLDASRGQKWVIQGGTFLRGQERDIGRPKVEAPDTFFLEARVGIEWQLNPKWSLFLDTRYEWADKAVEVSVNDERKLGRSTPNGETELLWRTEGTPFFLTVPGPDGPSPYGRFPDAPGNWFVNGGELDYGGFSFGFGARVSF